MGWRSESPKILQLVGVTDANGDRTEPSKGHLLFLRPEGDGVWRDDDEMLAEWVRLMRARWEKYEVVLNTEKSSETDEVFFVMFLAENLLLTSIQKVPGIYVSRIDNSTYGSDAAQVLSDVMKQRWFNQVLDHEAWLTKMQKDRPVVIVEMHQVRASSWQEAGDFGVKTVRRLLTLLSMRRHSSARLIAGVVGRPLADGSIEYLGSATLGTGYTGNLIGGFASGEDIHSLQAGASATLRPLRDAAIHVVYAAIYGRI